MADPEPRTRDELRAARGEIQALRDETMARLESHSGRLAAMERVGLQGVAIGRQVSDMVGQIRDGVRIGVRAVKVASWLVAIAALVAVGGGLYLLSRR